MREVEGVGKRAYDGWREDEATMFWEEWGKPQLRMAAESIRGRKTSVHEA